MQPNNSPQGISTANNPLPSRSSTDSIPSAETSYTRSPANDPCTDSSPTELDSLALRALISTASMLQRFDDLFEEKKKQTPSQPPNIDIIGRLREMRIRVREMRIQKMWFIDRKKIDDLLMDCIRVRKWLRDCYEHMDEEVRKERADESAANQYFMDQ